MKKPQLKVTTSPSPPPSFVLFEDLVRNTWNQGGVNSHFIHTFITMILKLGHANLYKPLSLYPDATINKLFYTLVDCRFIRSCVL